LSRTTSAGEGVCVCARAPAAFRHARRQRKKMRMVRLFFVSVKFTRTKKSLTIRSEEHTSELQSRFDLVCRLLLEKKKKTKKETILALLLRVWCCARGSW